MSDKTTINTQYQFANGDEQALPQLLNGEPALATDSEKLYKGVNGVNKEIAFKDNLESEYIKKSKLYKKVWCVLGDSVTAYALGYVKHISEKYSMTAYNHSYVGRCIAKQDGFCTGYTDMEDYADIVTVMGGINDINMGVTLGTMDDRSITTFYGSLHVLCQGLLNKYLGKKIGFILFPQIPKWAPDNSNVLSYQNAIKKVCAYYGIKVFDFYSESGLCPNIIEAQATNYFRDDTHPNEQCYHDYFDDPIANFMEGL